MNGKNELDGSTTAGSSSLAEKEVFARARQYLNLGRTFRTFTYLFAERKLLVFFWVHAMLTLIIWTHFALTKFTEQENKVPDGAPRYWWKRLVPPIEFGSMHAILFQMALIPLTMSRFSIAALSGSILDRFIPLNRAMRIHIHLGYVMVGIVFLATVFFFTFFGLLCSDGDQSFCSKFTNEIMISGYCILGLLLLVGATSFLRHWIPYETFYAVHHLVFILYILTIAHTLDSVQRSNERARSQTFKWFSATLLYYLCDRMAMHLNHKYKARVVASSVVTGKEGAKMIIVQLRRPALFHFKPGQYAYLRLKDIDEHWHPFSIASGPASNNLTFYIEVYGSTSWSHKLWETLRAESKIASEARRIEFDLMGPYGTGLLANTEDFSQALAIGSGTGIVPILSLFKKHVRQLLRLDPVTYLRVLGEHQTKMIEVQTEQQARKGSLASKLSPPCTQKLADKAPLSESIRDVFTKHAELRRWIDLRQNMKDIKEKTSKATRSMYGAVLLCIMPVFGISLIGLTISWNVVNFDLRFGMIESLEALTVVFQLLFAFLAIFIWDGNHLFIYIDVVLCFVSPFADWYWSMVYYESGTLSGTNILTYCLLTGYMTARLWNKSVQPRHTSCQQDCIAEEGFNALEKMHLVWVTRSASLASQVMPDLEDMWKMLVETWGEENALKVCQLSVYITDKDPMQCKLLKNELAKTTVSNFVHFGRPDLGAIIEDHTLSLFATRSRSTSVLAFCGSPELAKEIHQEKISNVMLTAITGHKQHQMEFVSEIYGGSKTKPKRVQLPPQTEIESDDGASNDTEVCTNREARLLLVPRWTESSNPVKPESTRDVLTTRETIDFSSVPTDYEV